MKRYSRTSVDRLPEEYMVRVYLILALVFEVDTVVPIAINDDDINKSSSVPDKINALSKIVEEHIVSLTNIQLRRDERSLVYYEGTWTFYMDGDLIVEAIVDEAENVIDVRTRNPNYKPEGMEKHEAWQSLIEVRTSFPPKESPDYELEISKIKDNITKELKERLVWWMDRQNDEP